MSFQHNIQNTDNLFTLDLIDDMTIENIEEIWKIFLDFFQNGNNFKISLKKVNSLDLSFLQLLVAAKIYAKNEKVNLIIENDYNKDLQIFINFSGLGDFIFGVLK